MAHRIKKVAACAVACLMTGSVAFGLTACGDDGNSSGKYTYRMATADLADNWNVHTYTSDASNDILGYTEDGLYTFDYNDTKDGYVIVPAMASEMPQDVTSQYVSDTKWGITSGDTWKAIRIELRHDLKFDNGDEITADDFVESMKLLLNPEAANYRADSYYGGQFTIVGAEQYAKANTYAYSAMVSANYGPEEYFDIADLVAGANNVLQLDGKDIAINLTTGGNWGSNGLNDYYGAGYFEIDGWEEFAAKADEDGYIKLDQAGLEMVMDVIAMLHGYGTAEEYAAACESSDNYVGADGDINYAYAEWQEMCFFGSTWPEFDFSNVGIKAVDDYTLDVILESSLSGFYLNYSLTGALSLVHPETYKSCISNNQGAYSNSYGTSKETYVGFGPYRISSYVQDSVVEFEKNPYWYGYSDPAYEGQYQTTNISIRQITDSSIRLSEFKAGKLDSYGLQAADMDDYQSSEYTYFTEGESTWFVALNPDTEGLTAAQEAATPATSGNVVNKTVLTIKEFRQALSFSIDRWAYAQTLDPMSSPALSLFTNQIVSDPENGTSYRTTDEAKQVLVDFWGLSDDIGPGKEYATIDEAISSITGYDPSGAKTLFTQAYNEAVESGMLPEGDNWEVQIVIGKPAEHEYYNNGYNFLVATWTNAVAGTPFEGHLVFKQSQVLGSTSFAEYLQNNQVDVLFGVGWTGSALDPYNLMEAYVSEDYQYDPGWDTKTTMCDVEINGQILRASVYDWGKTALQGGNISATVVVDGQPTTDKVTINAGVAADPSVRLAVLAAVENAVLQQYDMIPVGVQASASLKGMRIEFYTEEYIYGVGRGGVKYMTYTMDDAEWAKYVNDNGGELNYT